MRDIVQILKKIISAVSVDINEQSCTLIFNQSFEKYLSTLKPSLERYRHHLIDKEAIDYEELKLRFKHETAQLHVLTKVLSHNLQMVTGCQFHVWPVQETQSPFNWYRFPSGLSSGIEELGVELMNTDDPELVLSQVSYALLDEASKRYLGEFYTPLPIARHLVSLSGLQSSELISGKKVVDPACGGGIILTSIVNKVVTEALESKNSSRQIFRRG